MDLLEQPSPPPRLVFLPSFYYVYQGLATFEEMSSIPGSELTFGRDFEGSSFEVPPMWVLWFVYCHPLHVTGGPPPNWV